MNLKLISSDELLILGQRSVGIFGAIPEIGHPLSKLVKQANEGLSKYSKAFERESKNPFTVILFDKDGKRDARFYGLRYYVEAYSYHPDPKLSEAANKILDIIRKHGWTAPTFSYKAQTAAVTKIFGEMNAKCMSELKLINANEFFGFATASQDDFEASQKESVKYNTINGPTLLETRPALIAGIKNLFKMVDLKLTEDPESEEYKAYINQINELISITMTSARANATRKENKKKKAKDAKDNSPVEIK